MLISGYYCDECGDQITYEKTSKEWLPSKMQLIRFARKRGWTVGKYILCPDCRRGKKVAE